MQGPRRLLASILGAVLVSAIALSTTVVAAEPVVSVRPVVTGFSVNVAYSVKRPASRIAKQVCWLRNPGGIVSRVTCDTTPEASSTPTVTQFLRTFRLKKAGEYRFSAHVTLRSGAVVKGTRVFTIKPGPAVRFEVSGLMDQTIACDSKVCPGDWVNDVARQIAKVTARDKHGNRATGYTGTVVFDGNATTVSQSKLRRGVGFFAVKPTGLELNQFSDCASGLPADQDYKALTVTDRARPAIRGCQVIFYDIFFILDDLPIFRVPNITPDGCSTGCLADPTETIVIDTEARPLGVLEAETIDLSTLGATGSVIIAGETDKGQGFTQEQTLGNLSMDADDLPAAVADKCVGCSGSINITVMLLDAVYTIEQTPVVDVEPGGGQLKIVGGEALIPGFGFKAVTTINGTATGAGEPTCYKSYAALFNVHDGVLPCQ